MNQTSKHKNEKKNAFVNTRSFKIFHFLSISKGGCPTPQVSVIIFQHCPLLSVFHLLCIASIEEKIYWTQQSNLYDFGNRKHSNVWINNNYLISSNYSQIMDGNAKITRVQQKCLSLLTHKSRSFLDLHLSILDSTHLNVKI